MRRFRAFRNEALNKTKKGTEKPNVSNTFFLFIIYFDPPVFTVGES